MGGHDGRAPALSAIDSLCAAGSAMGSLVREVIASALRVASSANPAQAASAGLNPAVTVTPGNDAAEPAGDLSGAFPRGGDR